MTLSAVVVAAAAITPALAQDGGAIPPRQIYDAMLDAAKQSGWVQFRDFNGRQLVYFTALQTLHCRLSEIRYSFNSRALDQRFPVLACNPQLPLSVPSDVAVDELYLSLDPGSVKSATVQVVWEDGTESEIRTYRPCDNVGESTCAVAAE
ncbi:MAG: hypothetical protein K8H74_10520 [Notoacmeibacter sp.]|nr:hypothetical protein [Notoacmeibacter sp.]